MDMDNKLRLLQITRFLIDILVSNFVKPRKK